MSLHLGDGSSSLALYEREAAAQDAGVSSEGSGFRGVSFHFIVESSDVVDDTLSKAVAAGGNGRSVVPGSSREVERAARLANRASSSPHLAASPGEPSHVEQRLEPCDSVID